MGNGAVGRSCDTTLIYRANCEGEVKYCPHCHFHFCEYHYPAASNVAQLAGGHVCSDDKTTGAALAAPVNQISATIDATGRSCVDLNDNKLVYLMALCSEDVYTFDSAGIKHNEVSLVQKFNTHHLHAGLYRINDTHKNGKLIMAVRGSNEAMDWVGNIESWIGDGSEIRHAISIVTKWAQEAKVDYITGHSRGGCIAQGVCGMIGLPGAAFNSLTVYSAVPRNNCLAGKSYDGVPFEIHQTHGDVVSQIENTIPTSKHIGTSKWHTVSDDNKHAISSIIKVLRC